MAAAVATERVRHSEHGNRDGSIRCLYELMRDAAAFAAQDQGHWKVRHELFGANAACSLFGNHDPIVSGFGFSDGFACVLALAPGDPALRALRRLHQPALVQLHFRAADHQLLYKEGVAEPEDGADVVILTYAVEHDRDW